MVLIIIIVCLGAILYYINRVKNKHTYVYPKTGHKYVVFEKCKIKSPETGEWHDAYYYMGLDDNNYYAREQGDFVNKFISLKDWENGHKDK